MVGKYKTFKILGVNDIGSLRESISASKYYQIESSSPDILFYSTYIKHRYKWSGASCNIYDRDFIKFTLSYSNNRDDIILKVYSKESILNYYGKILFSFFLLLFAFITIKLGLRATGLKCLIGLSMGCILPILSYVIFKDARHTRLMMAHEVDFFAKNILSPLNAVLEKV